MEDKSDSLEDIERGVSLVTDPEKEPSTRNVRRRHRTALIPALILCLGGVASGIILFFGIPAAQSDQTKQFQRLSEDLLQQVAITMQEYTMAALWLQQSSRKGKQTREEFRNVYEYLVSTGLDFAGFAYLPNVTHAERASMENETRMFLNEVRPGFPYQGFNKFEVRSDGTVNTDLEELPFYFPTHYNEPLEGNWNFLDFNTYSTGYLKDSIDLATSTYEAVLTDKLPCFSLDCIALLHPGIRLSSDPPSSISRDVSLFLLRIPTLLASVAAGVAIEEPVSVFLYDTTDQNIEADFLGAALLGQTDRTYCDRYHCGSNNSPQSVSQYGGMGERRMALLKELEEDRDVFFNKTATTPGKFQPIQEGKFPLTFKGEVTLEKARSSRNKLYQGKLWIASRQWTVVVVAENGTFESELGFVIFGSVMIFIACVCLALWMYTTTLRGAKMSAMKSTAEAEKASTMVENAHKAATVERELNDFIAHEVRNPLSAAISATSFVASSVSEAQPLATEEARKAVQEDVSIIGASLMFINDLLRNMLDMHRASSNQLKIEMAHVDILRDVLEPVASMLYHRCDDFEVQVECPKNLMVMTDGLRLKQIVLNLGRNAVKFVEKGFVRLQAEIVDGMVQLSVEDSGPGIPVEKRDRLFSKFQESLDSLNQGTGIGLCVCRNLIDLMDGNIVLDNIYDSGIEGSPGSRFVIQLNKPAVCIDSIDVDAEQDDSPSEAIEGKEGAVSKRMPCGDDYLPQELPEKLSILFVDDDMLLRKLFARSIRKLMPTWDTQEASNGETALRLVEESTFDLIFMDQYMASIDKQLLGTETVRALRAKGVTSRICGLSANDMEKPFLRNGANGFLIKPFPCGKGPLTRELLRILYTEPELDETCSASSCNSSVGSTH